MIGSIVLTCLSGETRFELSEIIFIESEGHRCCIQLRDAEYHTYTRIGTLEEQLSKNGFLRIHRCFLVNTRHIRSIGGYVATLDNGSQLPISKKRYREIKQTWISDSGQKNDHPRD